MMKKNLPRRPPLPKANPRQPFLPPSKRAKPRTKKSLTLQTEGTMTPLMN